MEARFKVSYFNPRSPSGLRQFIRIDRETIGRHFNPRSPSGLRHLGQCRLMNLIIFQSTQPEWAATHKVMRRSRAVYISIHAARVGCDKSLRLMLKVAFKFQSTQPEWAATASSGVVPNQVLPFQSTQPEWAATNSHGNMAVFLLISIHAARVGCDLKINNGIVFDDDFNPRSPSGLRPFKAFNWAVNYLFQSTQPEWAAT